MLNNIKNYKLLNYFAFVNRFINVIIKFHVATFVICFLHKKFFKTLFFISS